MKPRRWLIGLLAMTPLLSAAADFSGHYNDAQGKVTVDLKPVKGGYAGTITTGETAMPAKAKVDGDSLAGTFDANGKSFEFNATLVGDRMTLTTGGATYTLDRPAAVNPLGTNPLGAESKEVGPDGVTLAATPSGKTVFFQRATAQTAEAAVRATVADAARVVGGPVTLKSLFADTKDPAAGGASFVAKAGGDDFKGMIFCKKADKGVGVIVTYAKVRAPAGDVRTLLAAMPCPVKMTRHDFPDGTGSIDLPEGWTTQQTTLDDGIVVDGPQTQIVGFGRSLAVVTPDSQLMQLYRQNVAFARAHGFPPPPPMKGILVAPFTGPKEAIKNLFPQLDAMLREAGKPGLFLDDITECRDAPSHLQGGKAVQIDYLFTKGDGDGAIHYRSQEYVETGPTGPGNWMMTGVGLSAPVDRFEQDALTMYAILQSVRIDPKVQFEHFKARLEAQRNLSDALRKSQEDQFEAGQKAHAEQVAGYERYNQAWRDRNAVQAKSHADFIEYVRGYRTVEDTRTGEKKQVDLGSSTQIVEGLNQQEPGRFKEIPMRDQ